MFFLRMSIYGFSIRLNRCLLSLTYFNVFFVLIVVVRGRLRIKVILFGNKNLIIFSLYIVIFEFFFFMVYLIFVFDISY